MDRRRFLAALGAGGLGGLAGCAGFGGEPTERLTPAPVDAGSGATEATRTPTQTAIDVGPPGRFGVPEDICQEEPKEDTGIYAVTSPSFAPSWGDREIDRKYRDREHSEGLADGMTVVGVDGDPPRAYPVSVLWHHEVVNDYLRLDGRRRPLMVTYCPLCRSGVVAGRRIEGQTAQFTVTGLLWRAPRLQEAAAEKDGKVFGAEWEGGEQVSVRHAGNLVMLDDATGSFWSQILAQSICGPKAGDFLDIVPSTVATWGEWRESHPDGEVLLPPPYSITTNPDRDSEAGTPREG
jgi:hypothetical protein